MAVRLWLVRIAAVVVVAVAAAAAAVGGVEAQGLAGARRAASASSPPPSPPQLCIGGNGPSPLFGTLLGRQIRPQPTPFIITRNQFITVASFYEGWVAFDDKARGLLFGTTYKQNPGLRTCHNRVLSTVYSLRTVVSRITPYDLPGVDSILSSFGLDPNSTYGAAGVGVKIGTAVAEYFLNDCANALGKLNGTKYNRVPYSDWTGYVPVNTAYEVNNISRWQPEPFWTVDGSPVVQEFAGAQVAVCKPFSHNSPTQFQRLISEPYATYRPSSPEFVAQAQRLIGLSANLTDELKALAEFINISPLSGESVSAALPTGAYVGHVVQKFGFNFDQTVKLLFSLTLPFHESVIAIFYYKRKYDSARPRTIIRSSGKFDTITAWGEPYQGTVNMKASEWIPYLGTTAPEPEHPSGGACIWTVLAYAGSLFTKTDSLNFTYTVPKGSSTIEPGFTPKQTLQLQFPTFSSISPKAQLGRQLGGFHFPQGTSDGARLCTGITTVSFAYAQKLINGERPPKYTAQY